MKKTNISLVLLFSSIVYSSAFGEEQKVADYQTEGDQTKNILSNINSLNDLTVANFESLDPKNQNEIAKGYFLDADEYQQYLNIKNASSIGQYYQDVNLDPNYYLADYYLQQNDEVKANKYIANLAKVEYNEVSRLAAIQKKFQREVHIQHPNETPVMLKGRIPDGYTSYGYPKQNNIIDDVMANLNLTRFTDDADYVLIEAVNRDDQNVQTLKNKLLELNKAHLDIYFTGGSSDDQILDWAKSYGLGEAMRQKKVTVNQEGIFVRDLQKRMNAKLEPGMLVKVNDGNYRVVPWSSVYGK